MHNLLSYASILVFVKYNAKYLLGSFKSNSDFCLFTPWQSDENSAIKTTSIFSKFIVCKKHKCCRHINKSQFVTTP